MAKDLLLEIGSEEIPASYLAPAAHALRDLLIDSLQRNRVACGSATVYFTPRRLAVQLSLVAEHQEKVLSEVTGPLASVAFDSHGNPTKAALGFARAQGVPVAELRVKETERGETVYCQKVDEGVETCVLLKELLPQVIREVDFPKTMWWREKGLRFARPIRWVVALFGRDAVTFEIAGLSSGRETYPHRFEEGTLLIGEPSDYQNALEQAKVVVDPDRRRRLIWDLVEGEAKKVEARAIQDVDLLSEVMNLVEYPVAILGRFDPRYLKLPSSVVITALREHQRYFAVEDAQGTVLPYFITVADSPSGDEKTIRAGNERILASRLEDAKFYWDEDRKEELPNLVQRLKGVVWQEGLGSLYDKTQRVVDLTRWLCAEVGEGDLSVADRAAYLAKADLVTAMVRDGKEFTKLQGVMGREYALASGERPEVARAIFEHYLPRYPGDQLPESAEGAMVSVADKVDTICGLFAAGKTPSGSQDPFGLRRQANGAIAILMGRGWHVSITALLTRSLNLLSAVRELPSLENLKGAVVQFFISRLERALEDEGISYDLADAVVAVRWDDPADAKARVTALSSLRATPDFERLVTSQKRVANILQGVPEPPEVTELLLEEEAEKSLYEGLRAIEEQFREAVQKMEYPKALEILLSLRDPIDSLFDEVLIMADAQDLRSNRLGLLSKVHQLFLEVADFSKIVLEGEKKREESTKRSPK